MNQTTRIGDAIKFCRNARKLTQGDLANDAELSVSYISCIEQGKRLPHYTALSDISAALDVPITYLIAYAELDKLDDELRNLFYRKIMECLTQC